MESPGFERQYLQICWDVLHSKQMKYRNGWCGARFNQVVSHDLGYGFPLLTTRHISFRIALGEFLWASRGHTNTNQLNSKIWDKFADEDGELGPIFGQQWANWHDYDRSFGNLHSYNQLEKVVEQLRKDSYSRRAVVSAWNVAHLRFMALPPCQPLFQLYHADDRLNLTVFCRSTDLAIGFPYDFALYSLMLITISARLELKPGIVTMFMTNAHIYDQHYHNMVLQITNEPLLLPQLVYSIYPDTRFDQLKASMYAVTGYRHHGTINYELIP